MTAQSTTHSQSCWFEINSPSKKSKWHWTLLVFKPWDWPNTLPEVSPWFLKEGSKELSRTRKIHLLNRIKTRTIRQWECRGPRGVVKPKFKVDCLTCGYQVSKEALSVGVFIGTPACGGIHNIVGACRHQRRRHSQGPAGLACSPSPNFVWNQMDQTVVSAHQPGWPNPTLIIWMIPQSCQL